MSLLDQFGKKFDLGQEITILDDASELDLFERGYLFTPSGKIVVVQKDQDHGHILSKYLSRYLNLKFEQYTNIVATKILESYNHFVYYGAANNYCTEGVTQYPYGNVSLAIPCRIKMTTPVQKTHVLTFLQKRFHTDDIELVKFQVANFTNSQSMAIEELEDVLEKRKKHRK